MANTDRSIMTPREIVSELDKYIVGQNEAKRAVAVALRNRWRRSRVPEPLHSEITPKNILMIGPTGVGKTEIARRLARLTDAPFVKTEATKFTEVGYVGRNVESIVRDLMEAGMKLMREQQKKKVRTRAQEAAQERVLDLLVPPPTGMTNPDGTQIKREENAARRRFREDLREGRLDDKVVEADVPARVPAFNMIAPEGMDDLENQLQGVFDKINARQREKRRLPIKEVLEIYTDEEAGRLIDEDDITRQAIDNVENNGIVFIDEIHTLAQAGSEKGETSPADMLKPYLARGEMQTIGATTTDEYRKFIEKDKALERRFQPIMVNPPSVEQTIQILKGLKDSYEAFHKITITDEAIEAAAVLSDRYISDRSLPDKAIDLIDEASSKAKVNFTVKPQEIKAVEEKIKSLSASRDEASLQRNYEKAAKLQSEIINLENDLKKKNEKFFGKGEKNAIKSIGANEIADVVAKWTGIPVTKITESEKDRLLHLEDILHKRVVGQNEAVSAVAKAIRRSRVGLQDSKRPIGSFLFMGQTGVGKTELCKAIAEAMFDDENNIVRIDMSEYMESHSVSKLIGSPPGYVGFEEGGQLTEAVRRHPYSVVLFDEIEKAHPDIFNALLQILDDGRLTDGQGRTVSFKNTIIIMTSNLGANEVREHRRNLGFGGDDSEEIDSKKIYMDALKHKFKPEFINRIDVICVFQPLTHEDLVKIAKILISNINKRLKEKNLSLKITEDALDYVVSKGSNTEYGARPLKRFIQQEIEDNIAEMILMGKLKNEGTIIIDVKDDELSFENE